VHKTQLQTSPLGRTGLEITRVGFGAWALRHPAVDGAITGFRRPDQVDPILAATGYGHRDIAGLFQVLAAMDAEPAAAAGAGPPARNLAGAGSRTA
jgi:aryl-alcohol dehydrogenase-like predicted oxidoreductase